MPYTPASTLLLAVTPDTIEVFDSFGGFAPGNLTVVILIYAVRIGKSQVDMAAGYERSTGLEQYLGLNSVSWFQMRVESADPYRHSVLDTG